MPDSSSLDALVKRVRKEAQDVGVRMGYVPEIGVWEATVRELGEALGDAVPFVEAAGAADNSDGEYHLRCQECEESDSHHSKGCKLAIWLERAAHLLRLKEEGVGDA